MPDDLTIPPGSKRCPYCAETILEAAIKCRYCGEFLNRPVKTSAQFPELKSDSPQKPAAEQSARVFDASPSLWIIFPAFLKTIFLVAVLYVLAFWPIKQILVDMKLSANAIDITEKYRAIAGVIIIGLVVLIFIYKIISLKSIHYRITPDRIEWARGIFEKRIDNIDMFRVVDLRLHRNFLDSLAGIGTVVLITSDKTDPEFKFEKVRRPKQLYDTIKSASLDSDAKRGVVHLE